MTDPRTPTSDPVAEAADFLKRLSHVDRDILVWIRGVLYERDALLVEAEARQQARAAFAAHVAALREALGHVLAIGHADVNRHGGLCQCVVHEDARAILAASPEPASPEASGSGLREAAEDDRDRAAESNWAALAAARPDGAEADATHNHVPNGRQWKDCPGCDFASMAAAMHEADAG